MKPSQTTSTSFATTSFAKTANPALTADRTPEEDSKWIDTSAKYLFDYIGDGSDSHDRCHLYTSGRCPTFRMRFMFLI